MFKLYCITHSIPVVFFHSHVIFQSFSLKWFPTQSINKVAPKYEQKVCEQYSSCAVSFNTKEGPPDKSKVRRVRIWGGGVGDDFQTNKGK